MATLVKRKPRTLVELLWPPGSGSIVRGVIRRITALVIVVVCGAVIASATMVGAYLVFSGYIVIWIAQFLAAICTALGQCADVSALLAALAGCIVVVVLAIMAVLAPMLVVDEPEGPASAAMSQATLLVNWYCLSPQSRQLLLTLLETSEAEPSEAIIRMLANEHKSMMEVMHGSG